jgi:hypothetical protein
MSGLDFEELKAAVKKNCDISDARYWGSYSICGLLLSLRNLFRHEKGIRPWEAVPQEAISSWIAAREAWWQQIEGGEFAGLSVGGRQYGPFDLEGVNRQLAGDKILYGAGYGVYGKPSFFLAELLSSESVEGYDVSISGCEFTRDLAVYPAMLQDTAIFVRREALVALLWDKLEEIRLSRHKGALRYAFSQFGITPEEDLSESLYSRVWQIAERETGVYIRHEIGEAVEGNRLGGRWRDLLSGRFNRRVEIYLRSVKDVLSDTSEKGMLKYIIENEKKGALGFYLSLMGGFRSALFPEILELFPDFTVKEDWLRVEKARKSGYEKARALAEKVLEIFRLQGDNAGEVIERELIDKGLPEQR